MAEIYRVPILRHLRAEPSFHILRLRRGGLVASGRGLAFWFRPLSASVAEIPMDDRELPFLFHGRAKDFQDTAVQGVITYRVVDPERAAARVDFALDLATGATLKQPLEKLAGLLTELAQQFALGYVAGTELRHVLAEGVEEIRERIWQGLREDTALETMGLEVVSVRVGAVKPVAEVEKALQIPVREAIQQEADEATFRRRAQAVEKERAIQENELQTQVELTRREAHLIHQRGENERKRATDEAGAARIAAEAAADLISGFARGRVGLELRTMVEARLDDGQRLLALSEVFVGHQTDQSARYRLTLEGEEERHSSSGLIVSTGTGATGWARSINLSRRHVLDLPGPTDESLAFFVREAFPSVATGTRITGGRTEAGRSLAVTSEMHEGGVVFGDGIEEDHLELAWGQHLRVQVAPSRLSLVRS